MSTGLASHWRIPPPDLALTKDDVHLWLLDLDQSTERVQELVQVLSPDELQRAGRFYFAKDRKQVIIGRAWLRMLLGRYMQMQPAEVCLSYGTHGKPQVPELASGDVLHFNLSHSQGLALYAFTWNRAVGVDVEHIHALQDAAQIVAHFFSEEEQTVFCRLPAEQQQQMFFKSWTQKEAYLKAIGEGLSRSLDSITVSLLPDEPARLLAVKEKPEEHRRWHLQTFCPASEYMAALAIEGQDWQLSYWRGL
jgi:4'-phosphopantetheinyl transferase